MKRPPICLHYLPEAPLTPRSSAQIHTHNNSMGLLGYDCLGRRHIHAQPPSLSIRPMHHLENIRQATGFMGLGKSSGHELNELLSTLPFFHDSITDAFIATHRHYIHTLHSGLQDPFYYSCVSVLYLCCSDGGLYSRSP